VKPKSESKNKIKKKDNTWKRKECKIKKCIIERRNQKRNHYGIMMEKKLLFEISK
jgi:hypothetical protein